MITKKRIYLSVLGYPISLFLNFVARFHRPFMVYGYWSKNESRFFKNTRISSSSVIKSPQNLSIGDNVWIWHNSVIDASGGVSIGEGTQVGAFVGVFSHSSHLAIRMMGKNYMNYDIKDRIGYIRAKVEIGEYVFVGSSCVIYPGAIIGKGSVVLPGSHVKGKFPPNAVLSGSPAKAISEIDQMDRLYLHEKVAQENYFDQELLQNLLTKFNIKKHE